MSKHKVGGKVTYAQMLRDCRWALVIGLILGGLIGFQLTSSPVFALLGSLLTDSLILFYKLL